MGRLRRARACCEQLSLCPDLLAGAATVAAVALAAHAALLAAVARPLAAAALAGAWPGPAPAAGSARADELAGVPDDDAAAPGGGGGAAAAFKQPLLAVNDAGAAAAAGARSRACSAPRGCRCRCSRRAAVAAAGAAPVLVLYALAALGLFLRHGTVGAPDASLALAGLGAAASVTRAGRGVVRVDAASEADLWFAQGAAHASTRLWQLEFQRRVGVGRLAEAVGPAGVAADRLMRTFGLAAAAARDFDAMPAGSPARAALERYAAGVNAYVAAAVTGGQRWRPLEFVALGIAWAPWTPVDSLVWEKVMSYDLAGNMDAELKRYRLLLARNLTRARVDELVPPYDTARFPTVLAAGDPVGEGEGAGGGGAPPAAGGRRHDERPAELLSEGLEAALRRSFADATAAAAARAAERGASRGGASRGGASRGGASRALGGAADAAAEPTAAAVDAGAPRPPIVFARAPAAALAAASALQAVGAWARRVLRLAAPPTSSPLARGCDAAPATAARPFVSAPGSARRQARRGARASNNWVVGGNLTASGRPILANDPHLQLLAPSLWQLTILSCPAAGLSVTGASFAGLPGVVIGRTARAAWGVTNTGVDTQDLYVLREVNATHYVVDGAPLPYATRVEVIKVAGAPDVVNTVRETRFGPVMTDNGVVDGLGGPPLALRWAAIDPTITDTSFAAFYGLQRVDSWASFRAALASWSALASQNVVYADVDGNIGYQLPGIAVRRAANHSGAYPVPGDTAAFDWAGFVPFDSLPRAFNPPAGFIVSANNRVQPVGTPPSDLLTADWDEGSDGFRARRISRVIATGAPPGGHTVASLAALQGDVVSGAATDFAAALVANTTDAMFAPGGGGRALLAMLAAWDGGTPVGSRLASAWADLYSELARLPAGETGTARWPDPVYLLNALARGDPACAAAGFASCGAFAAAALDAAAARAGLDAASTAASPLARAPAWGEGVHVAQVDHAVLSASALACAADRDVPHGGDDYTVNVGAFHLDAEDGDRSRFAQTHGPSYRHVVDLAAPDDASVFVHPMGVEGAPFAYAPPAGAPARADFEPASTYDDLLPLWAGGQYVAMDARERGPADAQVMRLSPA